jgi:hypothetical protein
MSTSYRVITPATTEPIALADMKTWLRVEYADDDALISSLITRARVWAENVMHRALATQVIQQIETIERPEGGELSGPINKGPSWYQYQEQLGANPFGAAQFYFDLSMPPVQASQTYTLETKITAFDPWLVFPQTTNPDGSTNTYIDSNREPGRLYVMSPITANFWRLTFTAGYDTSSYLIPADIKGPLMQAVAYFYENRLAETPPSGLTKLLLAHRVDWL